MTESSSRSMGTTLLLNLTSNWAGIVVNIGLSLFLAPMTVRSLGNEFYGVWALMMQFTGYLWLFDFGVRESVVKYVAQYYAADDHERVGTTVHTAIAIYAAVAVVAFAGACVLALALPYLFTIPAHALSAARIAALLTGATVALNFVFNVYVGVLMGLQRYDVMARIGIGFALVRAVVLVVLLQAGYGIVALALLQLAVTVASNLMIYRLCVDRLPYASVRWITPVREETAKLFNYGKYAVIANVGDKLIFASDSIVIGFFLPIGAVTYFAIGASLIDYFRSFVVSFGSMLNPLSSSLQARDQHDAVSRVLVKSAKFMVALGLPVCIGFVVLGERFVALWMGPEYGPPAGQVLAILAVGHLLGLPFYTVSGVLYGLGKHRVIAYARLFEAALNVALSLLLVRRFGIAGVAVGTVIPHIIVASVCLPMVLPGYLPLDRREYYLHVYIRPLISAAPFVAACWFIEHRIQPQSLPAFMGWIAAAVPVYLAGFWGLTLTFAERAWLGDTVRARMGWSAA